MNSETIFIFILLCIGIALLVLFLVRLFDGRKATQRFKPRTLNVTCGGIRVGQIEIDDGGKVKGIIYGLPDRWEPGEIASVHVHGAIPVFKNAHSEEKNNHDGGDAASRNI